MEGSGAAAGGGERERMKERLAALRGRLGEGAGEAAKAEPWEEAIAALPERFGSMEEALAALEEIAELDLPEAVAAEIADRMEAVLAALEAGGAEGEGMERDAGTAVAAGAGEDGKSAAPGFVLEGGVVAQAVAGIVPEIVASVTKAVYERLAAEPALKSAGFAAINTVAPHGDAKAHVKAWDQYIRRGELRMESSARAHLAAVTKAALGEDDDAEGGVLVPDMFSNDLIRAIYEDSWFRQLKCHPYKMTAKTLEVPAVSASTRATIVGEAESYPEEEPTTEAITYTARALKRIAKASDELLADSRFPVWEQVLSPDLKQAFAAGENFYFTRGTGTNQPQGVLTGGTLGVTAASASAVTMDEINSLFFAVSFLYRDHPSCAWMMADQTWEAICELKDGNGNYFVNRDQQSGEKRLLKGKPVRLNDQMPTMATGAKTIVFGAWEYYGIGDREMITIKRLNERYADDGEVGFRAFKRLDGRVRLAAALKYLAQA